MSYKEEHEAFVTGLDGSGISEVLLVSLSVPISLLFRHQLACLFNVKDNLPVGYLLDMLSIALPFLLSFTRDEYQSVLYGSMILCSIATYYINRNNTSKPKQSGTHKHFISYISDYRSSLLLMTCIVILAVDFKIFPRCYAKTETFGYSMMDIGVGSFVFSSGIVSRKTRVELDKKTKSNNKSKNNNNNSHSFNIIKRIQSSISKSSPLFIIGIIRLLATKSTDYQEHVSEYGVHWNFFFTLAFVSLFDAIIDPPIKLIPYLATLFTIIYQVLLNFGLENYILDHPRVDIFSMNKEGFCSTIDHLIGYLSIYFYGIWIGSFVQKRENSKDNKWKTFFILAFVDILFWILTLSLENYVTPPSRRMVMIKANSTYVVFSIAYNLFVISTLKFVDILTTGNSLLVAGFNRNGLFLFLIANLCTGAVNISIKTIYASDLQAFIILFVYTSFICFVSVVGETLKLNMKFW